jgi:uncharacterized protein YprB with RNaseH-like and TPR domain
MGNTHRLSNPFPGFTFTPRGISLKRCERHSHLHNMISTPRYDEISRHWRSKIDDSHDYEIIRSDSLFRAGFFTSSIFESEFHAIQALKSDLIEQYRNVHIGEVFGGDICDTPEGLCYCITTPVDYEFPRPAPEKIRGRLMEDLTLVRGIGPIKAELLKKRGYQTIEGLLFNRSYRAAAEECTGVLQDGSPEQVVSLVMRWHSPSHPLSILAAGLYGDTSYLFIDLETLGFFSRPIILFGIAEFQDHKLVVKQYLVRQMDEEPGALHAIAGLLKEKQVIITFNGKTFDLPYLLSRSAFYGTHLHYPGLHVDLLHVSRRSFRGSLRDCRLATIEKEMLNIERRVDIPGTMVPEFYESYHRSGNPGPLIPIVEHNREDIISLARLLTYFSGC